MSIICEESHMCFGKSAEPAHRTSHLCFGKRYRPHLDELEARAVVAVLEEAVDQLAMFGRMLPEEEGIRETRGFKPVSERFNTPPPSPRLYPEMAGRRSPSTEALLQVQRDRQFTASILSDALTELRDFGSFTSLRTSLDWQGAMMADERTLLEQYQEGLEKHAGMIEQLSRNHRTMLDQYTFWENKTEFLTSYLQDAYLLGGLAISYADVWEHNRREQQALVLGRKENVLHETIKHIKDPDEPNEERVHSEIMHFLEKDTEMLKENLDHWTDLYDAEMMQRETENMQLRNALEQQKEEHKELQEEEHLRAQVMEQATVLRTQYEEKKKVISSIVAIQAWWRGVSFRAGLSIPKKKKGKKGSKKKGKQKTKKGR